MLANSLDCCAAATGVLEQVLDCLFVIARAGGKIHPAELEFLARVADAEIGRVRADPRNPFGPG